MDAAAIIDEIESGALDGQLTGIVDAVKQRSAEKAVEFCWRIEFAGMDISEENLTIAELDKIERAIGQPWFTFTPQTVVTHASALLMVCLRERLGYDADRAADALKQHTWRKLRGLFSEYEVDGPKAGGTDSPS